MHSDKGFVVDLFKVGISAYVLKQDSISDLILALKAVKGGGTYFNTMAPNILATYVKKLEMNQIDKDDFETLSFREQEVFCLLADGKHIKKIGDQLHISPKTVESHKYNIMEKLNVNTMADLTKIAIKKNLIKV
jgi:DNA-binding NarL/FixJ family response regulator